MTANDEEGALRRKKRWERLWYDITDNILLSTSSHSVSVCTHTHSLCVPEQPQPSSPPPSHPRPRLPHRGLHVDDDAPVHLRQLLLRKRRAVVVLAGLDPRLGQGRHDHACVVVANQGHRALVRVEEAPCARIAMVGGREARVGGRDTRGRWLTAEKGDAAAAR